MSRLRQRATRVRDTGAALRRNYNPTATSPAYRRYLWWQKETGYQVERENYCRITMIWAPLRMLGKKLAWMVQPLYYLAGVLALLICLYGLWEFWRADGGFWHKLGMVVFWAVAVCWVVLGAVIAATVLVSVVPDRTAPKFDPMRLHTKVLMTVGAIVSLPAFLAVMLLGLGVSALIWAEDNRLGPRAVSWMCTAHFAGVRWISWFRPVYILPMALVGLSFDYDWARKLLLIIVCAVLFVTLVGIGGYLSDEYKQKQCDAERHVRQAEYLQPRPRPEVLYTPAKPTVPRQPGRFKRLKRVVVAWLMDVLDVVVDFLALTWALVVAKKWGICPFVVLPTQQPQPEGVRDSGVQEA